MNRFKLGDIVCCYPHDEAECYGVVVRLPTEAYPRYRVRITTTSFRRFVEMGVLDEDMVAEPPGCRQ